MNEYRGIGTTSKQISSAPLGSIYIWLHADTYYPRQLAKKLGREDLTIVGPDWLSYERYCGLELTGIVVDHATRLTPRQWDELLIAKSRIRSWQS